jgi:hypothetical protein
VTAHKKKTKTKGTEFKKARESGNKADWCGDSLRTRGSLQENAFNS